MEIFPGMVAYIFQMEVSWICPTCLLIVLNVSLFLNSAWIDPMTDISTFEDVSLILFMVFRTLEVKPLSCIYILLTFNF